MPGRSGGANLSSDNRSNGTWALELDLLGAASRFTGQSHWKRWSGWCRKDDGQCTFSDSVLARSVCRRLMVSTYTNTILKLNTYYNYSHSDILMLVLYTPYLYIYLNHQRQRCIKDQQPPCNTNTQKIHPRCGVIILLIDQLKLKLRRI